MSVTPRQAELLAALFDPDETVRRAALADLIADPVAAASAGLGPHVRARLGDTDPVVRLVAAEYLWRVSGDPYPALDELHDRYARRAANEIGPATALLRQLGPHAVESVRDFVRLAPEDFNCQSDIHAWAARTVLAEEPDGLHYWAELFGAAEVGTANALLVELADAAPRLDADFAPIDAALAHRNEPEIAAMVGAVRWRVHWRVNRAWLDALSPDAPGLDNTYALGLVTEVLVEHLGRRPDLAPQVRAFLVRLARKDDAVAAAVVKELARLGGRGWGVLLLVLQDIPYLEPATPDLRGSALAAALGNIACLSLVHHHAHRVIAERAADPNVGSHRLVTAAVAVLNEIGPAAGTALPDLLQIAAGEGFSSAQLANAAVAIAPGHPTAVAAVVRALGTIPANSPAQFACVGGVLHRLDPEAAPRLVADTSVPDHVVSRLLDLGCWQVAAPDVRARHAAALANELASPQPAVRERAADALKHYLPQLAGVWPALVAALAGEEAPAVRLLPYFRALGSVAAAVAADLEELFADPNTDRAARAAVALWRVRRWDRIGTQLKAELASADRGRALAVVRGMAPRAQMSHGLLEDLGELLAGVPDAEAGDIRQWLVVAESPLDARLSVHLPTPPESIERELNWLKLREVVEAEIGPFMGAFLLAVMSGITPRGWNILKIWMIKEYRARMRVGLAESKAAVEAAVWALEAGDRSRAFRAFFPLSADLPADVCAMLEHASAWVRWAGLELADGWGLLPREAELWVDERHRDAVEFVRARAARIGC